MEQSEENKKIMWIDSHAHLSDISESEFTAQLNSAKDAKVYGIINVATNLDEGEVAIARAKMQGPIKTFAALGISVPDSGKFVENFDWIERLINLASSPEVVAIGETGIDGAGKAEYSPLDMQMTVFEKQIEIAKNLDKPLIVHSRMLEEKAVEICISAGVKKAVFHCFTGTAQAAKKITDAGYFISFSGIVTFAKSKLDDTVKATPVENLLVETDAPWLAPTPYRGKRNEPAYVGFVGEKIAQIKEIDKEILAKKIRDNAEKFFGVAF
jgi:TatD DNase family protein